MNMYAYDDQNDTFKARGWQAMHVHERLKYATHTIFLK